MGALVKKWVGWKSHLFLEDRRSVDFVKRLDTWLIVVLSRRHQSAGNVERKAIWKSYVIKQNVLIVEQEDILVTRARQSRKSILDSMYTHIQHFIVPEDCYKSFIIMY